MAIVTNIPTDDSAIPGARNTQTPELNGVMHEHVYERLREALMSGQLSPGRSLSMRGLAAEFGVSAMPAREAIRRLVAIGAMELTDTRRVTIAKMTVERLEEIRIARSALEPSLAERSLLQVSGKTRSKKRLIADLKKIDEQLNAAIHEGSVTDYAKYNSEFHFTLYRASDASVLLGLVESLWLQIGPFMRIVVGRLGTTCLTDDQHPDIIAAVEDEDPKRLKAAVRADILQGMNNINADDFDAL
ncbi:MAG: GntR family transcriptional regulator [Pseudomonadota bacterium]